MAPAKPRLAVPENSGSEQWNFDEAETLKNSRKIHSFKKASKKSELTQRERCLASILATFFIIMPYLLGLGIWFIFVDTNILRYSESCNDTLALSELKILQNRYENVEEVSRLF